MDTKQKPVAGNSNTFYGYFGYHYIQLRFSFPVQLIDDDEIVIAVRKRQHKYVFHRSVFHKQTASHLQ